MKRTILKISAALIVMIAIVIAAAIYFPSYSSHPVIKHYYEQGEGCVADDECESLYEVQAEDGQYGVRLGESWIIQPRYSIIRETDNGYACKKGTRYEFIYNNGNSLNNAFSYWPGTGWIFLHIDNSIC